MCYIFFHKQSLDLTNSRAYSQKNKLKAYKIRVELYQTRLKPYFIIVITTKTSNITK